MVGPAVPDAPVIFLPGILMPAAMRYDRLLEVLGKDVRAVTKELEVYRGPSVPPPGYSLGMELDGIARAAVELGFERFHLYGHSGGGACALAFTAVYPERVQSLALDEPATDFSPDDLDELRRVQMPMLDLPPDELMSGFVRTLVRDGVEPPPGPPTPPPWMAGRSAGVAAFVRALASAEVAIARLRTFGRPVYYSYGSFSNETWERKAGRLARLFSTITVERYEGLSHLRTSHVAEPERVAAALRRLWGSAAVAP
jgi:pimeloyl-ACP methyl ester carboxylesterase